MIIDVKEWTRRLQEAIDQTFPGMQLKVEENVKSLSGMIKDSHHRRGISDEAAQQKEIQEIIATVKTSKNLGDDLRVYMRAVGRERSAVKIDAPKPVLMLIDVEEWTRRIQEVVDHNFPEKQLRVDEGVTITKMIEHGLDRRGILNEAARQKEVQQIIAVLKASKDVGDDLGLYMRAFGANPVHAGNAFVPKGTANDKAVKRKRPKRKATNFPRQPISPPPPDILKITRNHVLHSKDTPLGRKLAWKKWKAPTAKFVEGGDCCPK
jgi:hypothetical protein